MKLLTESYQSQAARWPRERRHILAQWDEKAVVVYQAYRPDIADFAIEHGYFGGSFSFTRMSWIKPNFLWMMFRCGWATKPDQERVLAISIHRAAFDEILATAVHSSFDPSIYCSQEEWRKAVARSDVRLQWDPDHGPTGAPLSRRAIQLGMRGETLRCYAREWIVGIEDVTQFAQEQHAHMEAVGKNALLTPEEHVYPVHDASVAAKLKIGITP